MELSDAFLLPTLSLPVSRSSLFLALSPSLYSRLSSLPVPPYLQSLPRPPLVSLSLLQFSLHTLLLLSFSVLFQPIITLTAHPSSLFLKPYSSILDSSFSTFFSPSVSGCCFSNILSPVTLPQGFGNSTSIVLVHKLTHTNTNALQYKHSQGPYTGHRDSPSSHVQ